MLNVAVKPIVMDEISLKVSARVDEDKFHLEYNVTNSGSKTVFLFNLLWDTDSHGDVVAAPAPFYMTFLPQRKILHVSQQIPPLPKEKRVEQRVVPFVNRLRPGESITKTYDVNIPIEEYNPYFPREQNASEEIVKSQYVVFTLQFIAELDDMKVSDAPIGGALLIRHPQLLAHLRAIESAPQQLHVTVKKRMDQFEHF